MFHHKRYKRVFCILLSLLLLTGCWDQRLLKDLKLVFTVAFDAGENDEIISHVAIRETQKLSIGGKPGEATVAVVEGDGITLRDTRLTLDRRIPGEFSPSKMRVYLMGEELAKQDLYSILDILYRDPKSPLGSMLAIVQGKAEEVIHMQTIKETLLTEALTDLLVSNEDYTIIKNETVQTVCPVMFDPSADFSLPVIKKIETDDVEVVGMGLISDRKFTGVTLDAEHSTILLLLGNNKRKIAQLNMMVKPEEENIRNRYMTLNVGKAKANMKAEINSPSDIKVNIELKIIGTIAEYPKNHLVNKKVVKELESKATEDIEVKAQEVIKTLQEANSDILKIGQYLKVHHNTTWKELDWREVYPTIEIIPNVSVDITGTGIIN
ncbi:Ger(x)C family spore germination protein [Sutcliffiella horikoshii]|uniref:Ger(x)C family spore germination protein n=1 Tax=Sutcliffiella horikoshii TaxID=79883 RepID=UPI001EECFD63|nr:Ger(x)C family spore germination protein [Sutcliffiella horikoshii]MCG1020204.1 Ger(x)C family spore germination protein [Sutcliffiella horikoshii]